MFCKLKNNSIIPLMAGCATLFCLFVTGCSNKNDNSASSSKKSVIQNAGSDTVVNLAQTFAEEYAKFNPAVSVEVSGGGSGTGIAALINGTVDIANSSRQMTEEEIERTKQNTGKEPKEIIVGLDALAVYVHKGNPLEQITIEQLAEIYGEGGSIDKWSQLGIYNLSCSNDEIIRVSRQSNSGTYFYFREALLGKNHDFKLGSRDLQGSKDVVELIGRAPCAIGYSGMGYGTENVKKLKIARKTGETAYGPNIEATLNGTYPISRPLYMYTLGEPTGKIKEYLDWITSDAGQKLVETCGYVPVTQKK